VSDKIFISFILKNVVKLLKVGLFLKPVSTGVLISICLEEGYDWSRHPKDHPGLCKDGPELDRSLEEIVSIGPTSL
jgi:hypothetical protein